MDEKSNQVEKDFVQSLVPTDRKSYEILKWKSPPIWTISLEQPAAELTWFQDGEAFLIRDQRGRVARYRGGQSWTPQSASSGDHSLQLWRLPESILSVTAKNRTVVVTLTKDGGYLVDDRPVEAAVELMNRLKSILQENPDREVVIDATAQQGREVVKQLAALARQVGAKRVRLPDWVEAEADPK